MVKVTNLIKFYIILLLSNGPKHGYELIKELGEKLGRKISASNIYPFLKVLKRNKLVDYKETEEREKKVYHLTKRGRDFVSAMLSRFGDLIDIAVEPRLSVCAHCGCKVYEGSFKKKIKGKILTFCCCHCAKTYKDNEA
jgi:DNA-binding PadR family transcriptional regulator